jgi:carbamate kinase
VPTPRRIVIALGGNAISSANHRGDIDEQFAASRKTAAHIADLLGAGHHILLTHGNGPQVGATLRRVELSRHEVYPIPLSVCVANTQAGMGYMICESIRNEMASRGKDVSTCAVITTVEVDPNDEAFRNPVKAIGQDFDEATARGRVQSDGWQIKEVAPGRWRRVVASPEPKSILELELLRHLFEEGRLVVCGGGGGVPVVRDQDGRLQKVDAVVDKDLTAALLAVGAGADMLAILTETDYVYLDFGTKDQRPLDQMTVEEAIRYLQAGQFGAGSMAPKIRACIRFLEHSDSPDRVAVIARTDKALEAIAGTSGTRIVRG